MYKRESEFHFSPWIAQNKPEIANAQNPSTVKINISNLHPTKPSDKKNFNLPEFKRKKKILTDTHLDSKSSFSTLRQHPFSPPKSKIPKEENINSFLPNANQDFVNEFRQQNQVPKNFVQGDDGDIPVEGPSLAPTNEPRVVSRFAEKDMSLFQFSQEFKERFGAVWNSEDRMVPPTSPLHPGDIVYYKVYISSNGHLEKYENLSRLKNPRKNYDDVDVLFSSVVSHVFPMSVPPKFANKNLTLTEVIAIQVVDRSMPARYSF